MSTRRKSSGNIWTQLRAMGTLLTYCPTSRNGVLVIMPGATAPSREDTLALFERIDPDVRRVDVASTDGEGIAAYERASIPSPAALGTGPEVVH